MSTGLATATAALLPRRARQRETLPGFGLTLGYTVSYLSLVVLLPLSAAFIRASDLPLDEWRQILLAPRELLQAVHHL